jgi:glycine betaine/proline transport system substrate-binding protein
MNANFAMSYLAGGDDVFGPDFGGATVFTNVRAGYLDACPNVGALIGNLRFTLAMENAVMAALLDDGKEPAAAATAWLKANPDAWAGWLDGITTFDGQPGLDAVKTHLGL